MGLGLLYGGIVVRPDQHVLTTEHDFYATHEALRLRAERTGASVEQVRLYDDPAAASEDEVVGRLVDAITASTRVVAVTWVHSGTGVKLPIAAMSAALAELNRERDDADRALLCVDGVHGLGCGGRLGPGARRRLPRRRHAQVAVRAARHGDHLGAGRCVAGGPADDPHVRRRPASSGTSPGAPRRR